MEIIISILKRTKLFSGIDEKDIESLLKCLNAQIRYYNKNTYILRQGCYVNSIMLLVSGKLHIQQNDYWGNRTIINIVEPEEIFGESYTSPESGVFPNDILAAEKSCVVFFDVKKIINVCSSACPFHSDVVLNLFYSISEKNRKLIQKLGYISKRTTREKLLSYLSEQAEKHNSNSFSIPFNRQQLADYLSVDRSAMSNELSKMRNEGLIEFDKNQFTLLHNKSNE